MIPLVNIPLKYSRNLQLLRYILFTYLHLINIHEVLMNNFKTDLNKKKNNNKIIIIIIIKNNNK